MEQHLGAAVTGQKDLIQRPKLARILGWIVDGCLYAAVVLVPLFFLPFSPDVLELNKQTLLIVLTSIAALAWVGQAVSLRTFALARSWLHLVVAVFAIGSLVAALFSTDRYLSLVGNFGQMQWPFASILALSVFYLITANVVKGTTKLYHLILAFLASSTLVGILGFLQLVGVHPFWWAGDFAKAAGFNTIGTINSFGVYLTVPLILAASLTVLGCRDRACILGKKGTKSVSAKVLVWAALAVPLIAAIAIDYWVIWASILFGTALLVVIPVVRSRRIDHSMKLIVPGALLVISIVLLIFRAPLNLNLPSEVSPSPAASWSIARQTLQDHPLFGSGPGTWIYDYAKYRSVAVNLSQFWTVRFERGISAFLTLLASVGLVGMALWLILILSAVIKSAGHLALERNDDAWQAYLTVFTGWATVTFTAFFYNYNVAHQFVFWFLLALLAALTCRGALTWDMKSSVVNSAIVSLLFLFLCVAVVSVLWLSGQRLVAEAKFMNAVTEYRAGKPIQNSIDALQSAVSLNRWNDTYERNISQAYLIRASRELAAQADPDRTKKANASVVAAVDSAKHTTEISPGNVNNWANFALVLQSIASFTKGADERAIAMYQEALAREPNNPEFTNEIGKLHLLRSDAYRVQLQSSDEALKKEAEQQIKAELDLAAEALNRSISVKPDYAPAHYNLGLVYERQGRVQDAITKLEQVLMADTKNIGVAFQLSILYYRNNEKDKSRMVLEQIIAMDPAYSNARWYLASLYEEEGKYDDAIAQIEKVKELNPDVAEVDARLLALQKLRDEKRKPSPTPLPEPVKEEITNPSGQNEVKKP